MMRELTVEECGYVAGGDYYGQSSDYQDSQASSYPPDSGGTGGSSTVPPVGPPVPWEAVLGDLATFFNDMQGAVQPVEHGNDQNSYYDDGEGSAPLDGFFVEMFGWMPAVQAMPDVHYWDYLTQDVDSEFLMTAYSPTELIAMFSGGNATMVATGDSHGTVQFTVNGVTVYGEWHQADGTSTGPDDIVVNGGHWHFTYAGLDANGNLLPPPPPPPAGTTPTPAPVDPVVAAEQERQNLSTQLHTLLNQHGGHMTISFPGPNGTTESFDLAEFLHILDNYSLIKDTTNTNWAQVTGGAGQVVPVGNGHWQTTISPSALAIYAASAGGLDYLILHEVAHELALAQSFTRATHDSYIALGGTDALYRGTNGTNGAAALWVSESFANNIVEAVENQLGNTVTHYAHPGGGLTYSGTYAGP
jgi:hypothetical protein